MQFDHAPDRRPSFSFKWEKYKAKDILPMWVADTEFRCAEPILEAIKQRTEHGVLGYTLPAQYDPANEAVMHWLSARHDWQIEREWIVWMPGVVPAFNVACRAYAEAGDKVLIQSPNYPPLLAAPGLNQQQRVDIPTVLENGRWTLDFDALEQAAADPKARLFILCNPMNPVGSVLTEQELQQVSEICNRHNVTLCSDEIHCDLILDEQARHIPAGKLETLQNRAITLMAASKTFNIAGLGAAFAIIPNAKLRQQFVRAAQGIVPWVTVLGLVATEAAFTRCDQWYQQQLTYLRDNRDFLVPALNAIDGLTCVSPQATFLAWVDAQGLQVPNPQQWFEQCGVGPSPGADFGDRQFVRINFGCPRAMLEDALARLHCHMNTSASL